MLELSIDDNCYEITFEGHKIEAWPFDESMMGADKLEDRVLHAIGRAKEWKKKLGVK